MNKETYFPPIPIEIIVLAKQNVIFDFDDCSLYVVPKLKPLECNIENAYDLIIGQKLQIAYINDKGKLGLQLIGVTANGYVDITGKVIPEISVKYFTYLKPNKFCQWIVKSSDVLDEYLTLSLIVLVDGDNKIVTSAKNVKQSTRLKCKCVECIEPFTLDTIKQLPLDTEFSLGDRVFKYLGFNYTSAGLHIIHRDDTGIERCNYPTSLIESYYYAGTDARFGHLKLRG